MFLGSVVSFFALRERGGGTKIVLAFTGRRTGGKVGCRPPDGNIGSCLLYGTHDMNPQAHKIIVRLEAIALEATALLVEFRTTLETERTGSDVDLSMFKDTTRRLLEEFLRAPGKMLSHEKIRRNVMLDEYASDAAVRNLVKRARSEMSACRECPYFIKTISKRGYKLEKRTLR